MSRKKLVVAGDSWTGRLLWPDGPNGPNFRSWPIPLADMLDMDVVNVGAPGRGNEFIYNKIIDQLSFEKNIGLAIVMWSEHTRWDFAAGGTLRIDPSIKGKYLSKLMKNPSRKKVVDMFLERNMASTEYNFLKTLRWFNAFQNYCECNNIPYMQCSAFNVLDKNVISTIIDHPVFYKINKNNFYGWPIFHQIGGFNMSDKLNEVDPEMKKLRISDEDNHPNVEGHKFIAKLLYDYYVKTYERNS